MEEQTRFLHQRFEQRAITHPRSIAILHEEQSITFGELQSRANGLACQLIDSGIQPGDMVAILAERSIKWVVAMLAVLKVGAAYVPLDPKYPLDRIEYCLQDSNAMLLLTDGSIDSLSFKGLCIDLRFVTVESEQSPQRVHTADAPAYMIYTSGSTGNPKGVVISHRSICNHMEWMEEEFKWSPEDVFLQKTAASFDASVWEIYAPLSCGARMVIAPANPFEIVESIKRYGVTVVQFVPTVLKLLLESDALRACVSLRLLFSGGEALQVSLVQELQQHLPIPVVNLYGPTEAAIDTTSFRCEPGQVLTGHDVPLGKPIRNAKVYIVDEQMRPVSPGEEGELIIGGIGLALGYHNRDEITKEKFILYPETGERVYRTGDLVLLREDQEIEFRGRIDFQVKLRGLRIELGEIEATLQQLETVHDAAVFVIEDGEQWLVAYLNCDPAHWSEELAVRHLQEKLPSYMVPNYLVAVAEFPQLANGKLDRKALSQMPFRNITNTNVASNQMEGMVANIWAQVLGTSVHDLDRSFQAYGGHSLLAIRLASQIRLAFGVQVPFHFVFEYPTVREQANALSNREAAPFEDTEKTERSLPDWFEDSAPLSFGQQGILFLESVEASDTAYLVSVHLRFRQDLPDEVIETALQIMAKRHAALQTQLVYNESGEVQQRWVADATLSHRVEQMKEDELEAFLLSTMKTPFDLTRESAMRSVFVKTPHSKSLLLMFHHLMMDGYSLTLFLNELSDLLSNQTVEKEVEKEVDKSFLLFCQKQAAASYEEGVQYWKQYLDGCPETSRFPASQMKSTKQTANGSRISRNLSAGVRSRLEDYCQAHKVTPFVALLAVCGYVLADASGRRDVCIGVPIANRLEERYLETIGNFVNVSPYRIRFPEREFSLKETVSAVAKDFTQRLRYEQVPIESIIQSVVTQRSSEYRPLFQVMMVYNNFQTEYNSDLFEVLPGGNETTKCDLTFTFDVTKTEFAYSIEYCVDLFESSTIESIVDKWESALDGLLQGLEQEAVREKQTSIAEQKSSALSANVWIDEQTKQRLQAIWQQVFQLDSIPNDANFFAIGGHSLLAMKLIALINREFQRKLHSSFVFEHPTLHEMVAYLQSEITSSGVIPLVSAGHETKIWMIHPAGGELWCYHEVAKALQSQYDVYGIESVRDPRTNSYEDDLANMAKSYSETIRKTQPQGPYYLLGYSFGGNVAYEIACHLQEAGLEVGLLILMDSHISKPKPFEDMDFVVTYASKFVEGNRTVLPSEDLKEMSEQELIVYLLELARESGHVSQDADEQQIRNGLEVWQANNRAVHRHEMKRVYQGRTLFLRAAENQLDATVGWSEFLQGDLIVALVPAAHHFSIYKGENAKWVATAIQEYLPASEGRERDASDHSVEIMR